VDKARAAAEAGFDEIVFDAPREVTPLRSFRAPKRRWRMGCRTSGVIQFERALLRAGQAAAALWDSTAREALKGRVRFHIQVKAAE
jgi:hypothetical protein